MHTPNKRPKIGIIIPCYNHAEFVEEAINSVVNQDYPNKAIYFSDEGSTDASWATVCSMLEEYTTGRELEVNSIKGVPTVLSKNKAPNGPSGARNRLIKMGWDTCDAFMMLDADDAYLPGKITKSVDKWLDGEGLVGIVYTDAVIHRQSTGLKIREYREPYSRMRLEQECIISNTPLVSKAALTQAGLYDETMRTAEDWDLWLRITENFVAVHIPEALHLYRVTGKNSSDVVPIEVWQSNWNKISERIHARH